MLFPINHYANAFDERIPAVENVLFANIPSNTNTMHFHAAVEYAAKHGIKHPELFKHLGKNAQLIYTWASKTKQRVPEFEGKLSQHAKHGTAYARNVLHGPYPDPKHHASMMQISPKYAEMSNTGKFPKPKKIRT